MKRVVGGVISTERRGLTTGFAGRAGDLPVREPHPEERPGPGSYENSTGAFTDRSARIPTAPNTRQWLHQVAECSKGV